MDSSPVALPPIPRPLKRSASTASLPTPPRSYRRVAGKKSKGFCDSDSDVALNSDDELPAQRPKKRRLGQEKEVDEDAFWLGDPVTDLKTRSSTRRAITDSPDNPFLATPEKQVNSSAIPSPQQERPTIACALYVSSSVYVSILMIFWPVMSLMKSCLGNDHRQDVPLETLQITRSLPVLKIKSVTLIAVQILVHNKRGLLLLTSCMFHPLFQRYILMILFSRGVRRECKNPLYNHAQDRPFSPPPESKLAIDHPDYSPSIHCVPKRLFPHAHSKKKKQKKTSTATKKQDSLSRKRARQRSPSLSADEDGVGEIRPLKLDFGSEKKRVRDGPTLDQEKLWDAGKSV